MATQIDLMAPIEEELRNERVFALGQAGKKVERTLAALTAAPDATGAALEDLLHDAAYAVWSYLIMRESLGMYDHKEAMQIYGVPGRVLARVGVVRRAPSAK
jgi:hypothetical protein